MGGYIQGLLSFSPSNRLKKQTKKKVQNPKKAKVEKKEEKKKHPGSDGFSILAKLLDTQRSNKEKKIQGTEPNIKVLQQGVKIGHKTKQQQLFYWLIWGEKRKSRIKTAYNSCMRVVGKKVNKNFIIVRKKKKEKCHQLANTAAVSLEGF